MNTPNVEYNSSKKAWHSILTIVTNVAIIIIYAGILTSEEFVEKNYSNEEFVRMVYRSVLLREVDDGGLANWTNQLNNGTSRGRIIANICNSSEAIANFESNFGI